MEERGQGKRDVRVLEMARWWAISGGRDGDSRLGKKGADQTQEHGTAKRIASASRGEAARWKPLTHVEHEKTRDQGCKGAPKTGQHRGGGDGWGWGGQVKRALPITIRDEGQQQHQHPQDERNLHGVAVLWCGCMSGFEMWLGVGLEGIKSSVVCSACSSAADGGGQKRGLVSDLGFLRLSLYLQGMETSTHEELRHVHAVRVCLLYYVLCCPNATTSQVAVDSSNGGPPRPSHLPRHR